MINTNRKRDHASFARTAKKTKKINVSPKVMRGGTRLWERNKMEFQVYAIKDDLRNMFFQPQYFKTNVEAARYFKTAINNNQDLKYNCSDFSFWSLGTYDDETGIFTSDISKEINGRSVLDA